MKNSFNKWLLNGHLKARIKSLKVCIQSTSFEQDKKLKIKIEYVLAS